MDIHQQNITKLFKNYKKSNFQLMKNSQNLAHKFERKMMVNFEYMAKEDSLNIHLYDDSMNEVEKLKTQYHKIQRVIQHHYLIDELQNKFNQREIINKICTLSIFRECLNTFKLTFCPEFILFIHYI